MIHRFTRKVPGGASRSVSTSSTRNSYANLRCQRGSLFAALAGISFLLSLCPLSASALTNGDFSAGLDAWSTVGNVGVSGGELVLSDDGPSSSGAWQVVAAEATRTTIEFDVLGSLSDFVPSDPFGFADLFAVSIYLFNEPADFDPADGAALGAVSVLSIDADGPFDVSASVTPAARGGEWLHIAFDFDSPNAYFAPAFELFELAFKERDSTVRIDDVVIVPVPEPTTALLLLLGLAVLGTGRCSSIDGRNP